MSKSATDGKNVLFLVVTMASLGVLRVFVVDCFIKTESYMAVQNVHFVKNFN